MDKKEDICHKCGNRNNCSTFVFKPADAFYRIAKCCYFTEETRG